MRGETDHPPKPHEILHGLSPLHAGLGYIPQKARTVARPDRHQQLDRLKVGGEWELVHGYFDDGETERPDVRCHFVLGSGDSFRLWGR